MEPHWLAAAQVPLLTVLLLTGGLTKAVSLPLAGPAPAVGPAALVPARLRRIVTALLATAELALGGALLISPSAAVRGAVTALFVLATGVVVHLWRHRPEAGCGCFGVASATRVGPRTIARTAVIAVISLTALPAGLSAVDAAGDFTALSGLVLISEVALIAALSPEPARAVRRRLGGERAVPCAYRKTPVEDTLRALRASEQWRSRAGALTAAEPIDVWRDLCWRYVTYPGRWHDRDAVVVFGVHLDGRRPRIRVAVVDAAADELLAPA